MADDNDRVLWCLIHGESTPFEVIAPVNASMNQLKKLIKEEGIDVASRFMALWKVSILEASVVITADALCVAQQPNPHRTRGWPCRVHPVIRRSISICCQVGLCPYSIGGIPETSLR
jgi:hypothetical protein